jgi:hypothetical protein
MPTSDELEGYERWRRSHPDIKEREGLDQRARRFWDFLHFPSIAARAKRVGEELNWVRSQLRATLEYNQDLWGIREHAARLRASRASRASRKTTAKKNTASGTASASLKSDFDGIVFVNFLEWRYQIAYLERARLTLKKAALDSTDEPFVEALQSENENALSQNKREMQAVAEVLFAEKDGEPGEE